MSKEQVQKIKLSLSLKEVNFLLSALGELPAKTSMEFILKIKEMGQGQVTEDSKEDQIIDLEFSIEEVNFILTVLGKLPAENSMELILKIKKVAEDQLPKQGVQDVKATEAPKKK
jgi:hypothetical protein